MSVNSTQYSIMFYPSWLHILESISMHTPPSLSDRNCYAFTICWSMASKYKPCNSNCLLQISLFPDKEAIVHPSNIWTIQSQNPIVKVCCLGLCLGTDFCINQYLSRKHLAWVVLDEYNKETTTKWWVESMKIKKSLLLD